MYRKPNASLDLPQITDGMEYFIVVLGLNGLGKNLKADK